jgi:hypothetical protein
VVVHHCKHLYLFYSAAVVVDPVRSHFLVTLLLALLSITKDKVKTTAFAFGGALEPGEVQIFAPIRNFLFAFKFRWNLNRPQMILVFRKYFFRVPYTTQVNLGLRSHQCVLNRLLEF